MTITKKVWYEVRFRSNIRIGKKVCSRIEVKSFLQRKKAQAYFDELDSEIDKWLVLCEESICDVVYSKN